MADVIPVVVRTEDEVDLWVEVIGRRADPAVLLIGGATWSMDWWEEELCHRLADRGRRVVRYDQRDTGRSTSYPAGSPGYTSADLVTDAVAILEETGVDCAHVVGLSMGGGIAQRLAIEYRNRVATMTLISTSPIDPAIEDLPGPTPEIQAMFSNEGPEPNWDDRKAILDHIVEAERPYAGPGTFDEARLRVLAGQVFDRTHDMAASMTNHFILDAGEAGDHRLGQLVGMPTLILHGTADPLFPVQHGRALAASIPGARLIELDGVGHQLPPPPWWNVVIEALIEHTAQR